MQATKIHHLVHIGYDPGEQPEFEKSLRDCIVWIRDKTHHIVAFVEDAGFEFITEARRILDFDEFIGDYSAVLYTLWFPGKSWNNTDLHDDLRKKLASIPLEIKLFLQQEFAHIFLPINEENPLWGLQDWGLFNTAFQAFNRDRYSILKKARKTFLQKQGFFYSDPGCESGWSTQHNRDRREKIEKFSRETLWNDRIVTLYMPNWGFHYSDAEKFRGHDDLLRTDLSKDFTAYHRYRDALLRITQCNHTETMVKINHESIKRAWWEIGDDTEHIVAGEYRGQCVSTFFSVLKKTFGFRKVSVQDDLTLRSPSGKW